MTVMRIVFTLGLIVPAAFAAQDRPNILWITYEDSSPFLGCYGDDYADTPNVDRFAERSLRYLNAWSNAPVCAPARTTLISGMYATSLGGQHMRSESRLPAGTHSFPNYLRAQGYYCTNNVKEDYNLTNTDNTWDESSRNAHWENRAADQPFFAVFNITVTHESQIRNKEGAPKHDPVHAPIPPYHPDTPEVRRDWAWDYDNITTMDGIFAEHLAELEDAGLADDTIVFFYSDHGSGMPRHKRWTYQSGLHVPMIVHIPERFRHLAPVDYAPGAATERLVSFVDLAPTVLSLAGALPPEHFQGQAFMGYYEAPPRTYLHGFRDRMDERYDMVRAIRDERYLYIRNYMPHKEYGQHLNYLFQTPTTIVWKRMFDRGELNEAQAAFWKPKPVEELYDITSDPHQINNLTGDPALADVQRRLRKAQQDHARRIRDLGFLPESEIYARSEGTSPYEMARDKETYPLIRIMEAAETAASREPAPELAELINDSDSAVRYWAAMGYLIRGEAGVEAGHGELRKALDDASPSVRAIAAEALVRFGNDSDARVALDELLELADIDSNDLYTAVIALNAIDLADERAEAVLEEIKNLPKERDGISNRLSSYVPRLLEKTLSDLER